MKTKDSLRKKKRTEDRKRQEVQGPQCSQSLNCSWFYSPTSRLLGWGVAWTDVLLAVLKCLLPFNPFVLLQYVVKCPAVLCSEIQTFVWFPLSYETEMFPFPLTDRTLLHLLTPSTTNKGTSIFVLFSDYRGKVVSNWFEISAECLSNNLVVEVVFCQRKEFQCFLYCVHIKRLHIVLSMFSIWWQALFSPWLLHECAAFNIVVLQKHSWETVWMLLLF